MNHDIILSLYEILNEESSYLDRANEFVGEMRRDGTHAPDNEVKKEQTEDEDEYEIVKDDQPEAKKSSDEDDDLTYFDKKVKSEDESPTSINLAEADNLNLFIKLVNQLRASNSLKDKEVYIEVEKYFSRLTQDEKRVLHIFVKGLIQITSPGLGVSGDAAYTPSMFYMTFKKGSATSEKKRSIKRKQQSKEDAEKMSMSPIKIGESRQNKSRELSILKENDD